VKALVVGGNSFIGMRLFDLLADRRMSAGFTTRESVDLRANDWSPPTDVDAIFWLAAVTRFIECERNRDAFTVNVRAPLWAARRLRANQQFIYVSSEAAESAIHTAYGLHKALVESSLPFAFCKPKVASISKVTHAVRDECCLFLISLLDRPTGFYRWPSGE